MSYQVLKIDRSTNEIMLIGIYGHIDTAVDNMQRCQSLDGSKYIYKITIRGQ